MIQATFGSGNVFADLGFDDPKTEQIKSDLVGYLQDIIDDRDLTPRAAGAVIGLSAGEMHKLLRGRTGDYTVQDLRDFLTAFDSED